MGRTGARSGPHLEIAAGTGRPYCLATCARALVVRALAGVMEIDETTLKLGISLEEVRAAIGYEARIISQKAI